MRRRLGLGQQGGGGGFGGNTENLRGRFGQLKGQIMASTATPTNTQMMQVREVRAALPGLIDQANAVVAKVPGLVKELDRQRRDLPGDQAGAEGLTAQARGGRHAQHFRPARGLEHLMRRAHAALRLLLHGREQRVAAHGIVGMVLRERQRRGIAGVDRGGRDFEATLDVADPQHHRAEQEQRLRIGVRPHRLFDERWWPRRRTS